MTLPQERIYTTDDIYNLPDGERAELIDGHQEGVRVSHISLHLPFF